MFFDENVGHPLFERARVEFLLKIRRKKKSVFLEGVIPLHAGMLVQECVLILDYRSVYQQIGSHRVSFAGSLKESK